MERRQSIMRRRGKTFLSLFLSAVIVTGQPVLAADFSAGEETFISETTEQEGDVSEASVRRLAVGSNSCRLPVI